MTFEKQILNRYESMTTYNLDEMKVAKECGGTTYITCPIHGGECKMNSYFHRTGEYLCILNFPCKPIGSGWYQAWIDIRMGQKIQSVLQEEETKFRAALKKFEKIPLASMTPEKAVILWHSQGCPEEIAAELSTDYKQFHELVESHKETGKQGVKSKLVYG